jgi:uncharacterized protein DUF4382
LHLFLCMKRIGTGGFATSLIVAQMCAGCAGSNSSLTSPTAPSTAGSTLNVVLTDSPFTDAKAVLVTFSAVNVHLSGGAFVPLPFVGGATSRTCDLKKLTGAHDVLGTGQLTAGHYTQIRLDVDSAAIYFDNPSSSSPCATSIPAPAGRSASITVPSSEVILNREFDVTSTGATTVTLDFSGDQSIIQTGNGGYLMTPVISVVNVQ